MIDRIDTQATKVDVNDELKKHIENKLGMLDKFLPRHARKSAHLKVFLTLSKGKLKEPTCEAVLEVPNKTLTAKDSSKNVFAAVDSVESKMLAQIKKYKDTNKPDKGRKAIRAFLGKSRRSYR